MQISTKKKKKKPGNVKQWRCRQCSVCCDSPAIPMLLSSSPSSIDSKSSFYFHCLWTILFSIAVLALNKYINFFIHISEPAASIEKHTFKQLFFGNLIKDKHFVQSCHSTCKSNLVSTFACANRCGVKYQYVIMRITSMNLAKFIWDPSINWFDIRPAGLAELLTFDRAIHSLDAVVLNICRVMRIGSLGQTAVQYVTSTAVLKTLQGPTRATFITLIYSTIIRAAVHLVRRRHRSSSSQMFTH